MKNYQRFLTAFLRNRESFNRAGIDDLTIHHKVEREKFFKMVGIDSEEKKKLYEHQQTVEMNERLSLALKVARVYEVDDRIKRLLCMTNPPTNKKILAMLRLPFRAVFIETEITQSDGEINVPAIQGILIAEAQTENPDERAFVVHYCCEERTEKYITAFIDEFKITFGDTAVWYDDPTTAKFIRSFIINLILFIQNPEVEEREFVRSQKNQERRIRDGLLPLPNSHIIRLTGRIKHYVDSLGESLGTHFNYKFWVCGTWRHYKDTEHYKNLYALPDDLKRQRGLYEDLNGVLTQWIAPFQKGQGMEMPQSYKLVPERNDDRLKTIEQENLYYDDIKPLDRPLSQIKRAERESVNTYQRKRYSEKVNSHE